MYPEPGNPCEVLSITWNQDKSCFALGTEDGFAIWSAEPVQELCRRTIGGVRLVAMYYRSSVVALVGGGRHPFESTNKVMIWNDAVQQVVAHIEFKLPVLAVHRRSMLMVVVTSTKFYVYNFPDSRDDVVTPPKFSRSFDTINNPQGLFGISYNSLSAKTLLSFPANTVGHACIIEATSDMDGVSKPPVTIKAHKSSLAFMTLSSTGKLLATCSVRGTLVRVFEVESRQHLYSFRRGLTGAHVHSLAFNRDETMICGVFDEWLYVWRVLDTKKATTGLLGMAEQYLPSFDEITTPPYAHVHTRASKALCAFEADKTSILTVCWNGTARKYRYHDTGMQSTEFYKLLKPNYNKIAKLLDLGKDKIAAEGNNDQVSDLKTDDRE